MDQPSSVGSKELAEEMVIEIGSIDAHRLLLGSTKLSYGNTLTSREMEPLTAICDAFLPSVDSPPDHAVSHDVDCSSSIAAFYQASPSKAGTPEHVGEWISQRLKHPRIWQIRLILFLLSTCIGTFIICGFASISSKFPYFRSLSQLPLQEREKILLSWSLSPFCHLRMLFKTLKLLTFRVFFSQVDEKYRNLTWNAIGYPGPDPHFKAQQEQSRTSEAVSHGRSKDEDQECQGDASIGQLFGPLYRGLVNLNLPRDIVADSLKLLGFPVSVCRRKNNASSSCRSSCGSPSMVIRCDVVVVGTGSGGGLVAGVLAKAGYRVLVLEKGDYYARDNLSLIEGPTMDQMFLSGGVMATDDVGVIILAGSTVGGGSAINWSASIRTPRHVINEWRDRYHLELFDSQLYREALDVVCERMGVQSEFDKEGFNNAILRRGCQELGYPVNTIPRNSSADHYCGWCSFGCKDGRKKGTCETWLMDLVNAGNGAILPRCEAIKVLHKKNKTSGRRTATGVAFEFEYQGVKDLCVVESKVTVVACGALGTPALLKASGLKNTNIGKNLHLHPVTMAWGYFPETAWPDREDKSYEGGIMTAMSTVVANFEKSGYGAVIQTPSLHPCMFASLMPWVSGAEMRKRMQRFSRTAHLFALARDKGSGTVKSSRSISYKMEADDEENLQKGIEKALRILAAAGAEEIGTHHNKGRSINVKKASYNEFERFVKEESGRPVRDITTQLCSAHQMGSCRMGVDPKDSVVNQMGETWEVEGLYLADSSVFPTALGVNPMVTVQAIAYCTAKSVLEVLVRKKM